MKYIRKFALVFLALIFAGTSQAGLFSRLLPRASTVAGVAVIGAAYYASKSCKTVKDNETGQSRLVCKRSNIAKSESAPSEEKPNLLDPKGEKHVLDGDGPNAGGGHRNGTGKPRKSEFPDDWSDEKITGEISDIATDPSIEWSKPDGRGYVQGVGIRNGVEIKVVRDTKSGRIVTGYPLNIGRNK